MLGICGATVHRVCSDVVPVVRWRQNGLLQEVKEQIVDLHKLGVGFERIAQKVGCSHTTVWKVIKEAKGTEMPVPQAPDETKWDLG